MDLEAFLSIASRFTIALSGLSIIAGIIFIRRGQRGAHKRMMLTAAALTVVFVILYITRSSLFPPERYAGAYRTQYLFVLWSHTVLSLVNLPLAVVTIYLALKGRFDKHRRIAPYTAAVWIYVAFSGWTIFFFNS